MADSTIHLHKPDALNSHAVCGKVIMSASGQEKRMTLRIPAVTCSKCLALVPAKYR